MLKTFWLSYADLKRTEMLVSSLASLESSGR